MDTSNKFFVQYAQEPHNSKDLVTFMAHVPRVLSADDAMLLAAWLIKSVPDGVKRFQPYGDAVIGPPPLAYAQITDSEIEKALTLIPRDRIAFNGEGDTLGQPTHVTSHMLVTAGISEATQGSNTTMHSPAS